MISKKVFGLVVFFILLLPSVSFAYIFPVSDTNYTGELSLTAANVGERLGFEILKISLTKNNIPFSFGSNGMGSSFSINGLSDLSAYFSGSGSGYSDIVFCVIWPRTSLDSSGVCDCDYSIFGTFYQYYEQSPTNPSSNAYYYYVYFDSGVVTVTNYLGDRFSTAWENKSVVLNTNLTCSMPFDYSPSSLINYFVRPTRILNLTQTGTQTSPESFRFGSVAELFSYQFRYAFLQGCGSNNLNYSGQSKWFDLRTKQEINQSMLPWQLQIYNPAFDTSAHTKPGENFSADTDGGTEPDVSEYYTGHNYLNVPEDDWGQPADIGGGSGTGGEITGFSSGAQGQLTSAGSEALRDYFGSSSDLDEPVLDSTQYTSSPDEIQLDDYWLSDPLQETSDLLPGGASTFRTLVDRLKIPDSSSLPRWTLNFEVNTGAIAGTIWQGVTYTIDFATLKNAYPAIFTTLRTLAVVCMFVSLIIYLIKDNFLLGGNPSAGSEDD